MINTLNYNTQYFRKEISLAGFSIKDSTHPIVPIMLGDATLATQLASNMLNDGIYVIGFSFPVVPKNEARIRIQISASHTKDEIDRALDAFIKNGKELRIKNLSLIHI